MTDTPVREPLLAHAFDVEKARKVASCVSFIGTNLEAIGRTEQTIYEACDEIERLRYRDYQIKCVREELVDMAEERNRLRTRLALAEKALHTIVVLGPTEEHPREVARRALAAYDAAKDAP